MSFVPDWWNVHTMTVADMLTGSGCHFYDSVVHAWKQHTVHVLRPKQIGVMGQCSVNDNPHKLSIHSFEMFVRCLCLIVMDMIFSPLKCLNSDRWHVWIVCVKFSTVCVWIFDPHNLQTFDPWIGSSIWTVSLLNCDGHDNVLPQMFEFWSMTCMNCCVKCSTVCVWIFDSHNLQTFDPWIGSSVWTVSLLDCDWHNNVPPQMFEFWSMTCMNNVCEMFNSLCMDFWSHQLLIHALFQMFEQCVCWIPINIIFWSTKCLNSDGYNLQIVCVCTLVKSVCVHSDGHTILIHENLEMLEQYVQHWSKLETTGQTILNIIATLGEKILNII
jgi:hypothetical protein